MAEAQEWTYRFAHTVELGSRSKHVLCINPAMVDVRLDRQQPANSGHTAQVYVTLRLLA